MFLIYLVNLKWMGRGFVPRSCLAVLILVGGRFLGRNSLYRRHAEIIGRLRTPNAASRPFARFWAHAYFPGCATIVVANVWYTSESEGILWNAWMLGWVFFKWIQNHQKVPIQVWIWSFCIQMDSQNIEPLHYNLRSKSSIRKLSWSINIKGFALIRAIKCGEKFKALSPSWIVFTYFVLYISEILSVFRFCPLFKYKVKIASCRAVVYT